MQMVNNFPGNINLTRRQNLKHDEWGQHTEIDPSLTKSKLVFDEPLDEQKNYSELFFPDYEQFCSIYKPTPVVIQQKKEDSPFDIMYAILSDCYKNFESIAFKNNKYS